MLRFVLLAALTLGCNEKRPASPTPAAHALVREKKQDVSQDLPRVFSPQVAGGFYPDDPKALRHEVTSFMESARAVDLGGRDIAGIIAPHAGYAYSGPVAAAAYRAVEGRGYKTVVVLALNHKRSAERAAVMTADGYRTPLGIVPVDSKAARALVEEYPGLFEDAPSLFAGEHSLEVQLPFIQIALPKASVVPVVVAVYDERRLQAISEALHRSFGRSADVLFVVSSDMSHFYPEEQARKYDQRVMELLRTFELDEWKKVAPTRKGMCGYAPALVFLRLFEKWPEKKRRVTVLDYKNSADTSRRRDRVVGYAAMAFTLDKNTRTALMTEKDFGPFDIHLRKKLMVLAKESVRAAAKGGVYEPPEPEDELLARPGAAFVTLKKKGHLRGCIGHVIARAPLYKCVADVARAAAIHDVRFSPVTWKEVDALQMEISVLTQPRSVSPEEVEVGRDGLIVSSAGRTGLLLPQVPLEWGWDREEFLNHTCRKAGLPEGCWKDPSTRLESFRAIVWGEEDI